MTLLRFSLLSIVFGALGLIGLTAWGLLVVDGLRQDQREVAALIDLQERMDSLSAASDRVLLQAPAPGRLSAFREESRSVRAQLRAMTSDDPAAARADRAIDRMVELLAAQAPSMGATGVVDVARSADGDVRVAPRSIEVLAQMASHGEVVDAGLAAVMRGRQAELTRKGMMHTAIFGVAAMFYALVGVLTLLSLRNRLLPAVNELARVVEGVGGDDLTVRTRVHARHELAWFAEAFNRMLARLQVSDDARKRVEERLRLMAYRDAVTGRWSRPGFVREVSERLAHAWPRDAGVAVLELVHFRAINDAHGYELGDVLLSAIADRSSEAVGEGGIVARLGGDAFALYLPTQEFDGHDRCARLRQALDAPFFVDGFTIQVAVRIGHTRLGTSPRPVEELVREAEVAVHEVREIPHAVWSEFTPAIDRASASRVELTHELRVALDLGQFVLHFQPKVDLGSGRVVAGEALIRWVHPQRGMQSPGAFIPVAEQSGLIVPMGRWVLNEACRSIRAWRDAGLETVRISVNVSVEQFTSGRFADDVRDALRAHDVAADDLTLEITESVFERESRMLLLQLEQLRTLGVRLSLDDFGTGFSSLLYLKKYPFDEIKIDRAFVRDLPDDAYSRNLVATVQTVAAALGAEVVAEGVETEAQRTALLDMGCRVAQGFLFSKPLAERGFRGLLERGSSAEPRRRAPAG